jgi:hypothetical protein
LWFGFTTLIFIYILVRAVYNPLSHDELATYFHYVQSGQYLPPQSGIIWDANNHLLNSFLTDIFYRIFGNSALALRLPNVLSFLIYTFFIAKLLQELKYAVVRTFGFIALLSVAYLVEYFALARGYGMSMAFFIAALYYLRLFVNKQSLKHLIFTLSFIVLACLANLTLINSYGLILVFLLVYFALNSTTFSNSKKWRFFIILTSSVACILYPVYFSLKLKASGALYYGAKTGFGV